MRIAKTLIVILLVLGAGTYLFCEFWIFNQTTIEVAPTENVVDSSIVDSSFIDTTNSISK